MSGRVLSDSWTSQYPLFVSLLSLPERGRVGVPHISSFAFSIVHPGSIMADFGCGWSGVCNDNDFILVIHRRVQ